MLALFEILSFKGWLEIRDTLIARLGTVSSSLAGNVQLLSTCTVYRFTRSMCTFMCFLVQWSD